MSDKTYLGLQISDFSDSGKSQPISRITLLYDDDNAYTAGDDTGRELEISCPWATQEMANNLLASLGGYQYRPFQANGAYLDPAAELGDGVTVGGIYSVLASSDTVFDAACVSDISAPGEAEIDHEYPYETQTKREFTRKIKQTNSRITKTAEEIRLEVSNEISGLSSSIDVKLDSITSTVQGQGGQISQITQRVDGISSTVQSQSGQISKINQTVSSISSTVQGLDGAVSSLEQTVDSFTLEVSNGYSSSWITLKANGAEIASERIKFTGNVVFSSDLADGSTSISGDCIDTGQISARYIRLGGAMNVYTSLRSNADSGGYLGYMTGMTAAGSRTSGIGICDDTESALVICTNGGARMGYDYDSTVVCTSNKVTLTAGQVVVDGTLKSSDGTVITSDRRAKEDIRYQDDLAPYLTLFDSLRPVSYRLKGRTRRHMGLIAQEVESSMQAAGIASEDFGGLCVDEEGQYGLRYEEFIPILIAKIQKLESQIRTLEEST